MQDFCASDLVSYFLEGKGGYLFPLLFLNFFLCRGEAAEVSKQTLQAILEVASTRQFAVTALDCCAYAGTGNVLKVQQMLHLCSEHLEKVR